MAPRTTEVMLRVRWDDEINDHPAGWDWKELTDPHPFDDEKNGAKVSFVTFTDVFEKTQPDQV